MATNRAVKPSKAFGDPMELLQLVTLPKPEAAAPGKVVVRVLLRPVNPTDTLVVSAGYWANLDVTNAVIGSEGYGVVHLVGDGVTKVKVGQRVVPLTWSRYYSAGDGLWRDYVEVPEADVLPVPDYISDKLAAVFLINPWAAYGLMNELQIPKGGYLLQTAASSIVGRLLISLAKHSGIKSINVVRRDDWVQPLKDIGADYVINSSKEDVKAKVMEITGGQGAYGAVDPIGGESIRTVANSVRAGGKVIAYGSLVANHGIIDYLDLMRGVSLSFFIINDFGSDLPKRAQTAKTIFDLMAAKIIDPHLGKTFPLEQFEAAITESEKDARGGKVLLSSY